MASPLRSKEVTHHHSRLSQICTNVTTPIQQSVNPPERTHKATTHRERGDIIWLGEGPVVGGEGPGQRTLSEGDDKVDTPEKSHHVVDLQIEDVPL